MAKTPCRFFVHTKSRESFIRGLLARLSGFEPKAYRLGGGRSILLSYRRTVHRIIPKAKGICKAFSDLRKTGQDTGGFLTLLLADI